MLFSNKTPNKNSPFVLKSKTPTKGNLHTTPKPKKDKMGNDSTPTQRENRPFSKETSREPFLLKFKTRESMAILQSLEEIHGELNFSEYDIFPVDKIDRAKKNIEDLLGYLGEQPICRHHRDLLNLYCDTEKEVVCVSCVYKGTGHKGHKVKALETVEKMLDLETIRNEEKSRSLVHQLDKIKGEIELMTKEIGENYMNISKYTTSIIDETINELNLMRTEMEKKLSLSYRRTVTVINRYSEALDKIVNHLDSSMEKTVIMNSLSKHLLFKELTHEDDLIESLVQKFNENRQLMEQWNKSNRDFEKIVLRKRNHTKERVDAFVVTEF